MRQFKVNDELINKVKRLISNDDKDKLIMSLEELHYADLAEIFKLETKKFKLIAFSFRR